MYSDIMIYVFNDYFLLWKPRGVPSTFWEGKSILDYLETPWELGKLLIESTDTKILSTYVDISQYTKFEDMEWFENNQRTQFSRKQECGLLNRLDNATGGFLYFAKTPQAYTNYRAFQKQGRIQKTYLAFVEWNPSYKDEGKPIDIYFPIMHLASNPEKMIVVKWYQDENKWRWKRHKGKTTVELVKYFPEEQKSLVKVTISKWIRHQIRAHLATIGAPIIGDILYNKKSKKEDLQLWSVWFSME